MVEDNIRLVTALNPFMWYEKSTEIAHEALTSGRPVYEIVLEKRSLTKKQLDDILSPENIVRPCYLPKSKKTDPS